MAISQAIAPHLPQLRRFARALTGSQKGGDAYVVDVMELIVAEPGRVDVGGDVRCSLYRIFLDLWRADALKVIPDKKAGFDDEVGTAKRLDAISTLPRVALLLVALEGFDLDEVGRALGCSTAEAKALMDTANDEIGKQITTDVLIIEDEPLVAMDLQNVVEDLGHKVSDVARTHREALKAVRHQHPGLILADIQLEDGSSGLEAVDEILGIIEVPVIFITAYPERFLVGAPPEPAYLIAKPFSVQTLRAIISQVLFFDRKSHRRRPV